MASSLLAMLAGSRVARHRFVTVVPVLLAAVSGVSASTPTSNGLHTRAFSVTYEVVVEEIPAETASFAMWLPLPVSTGAQTVGEVTVQCDLPYAIDREPEYGNRILHVQANGTTPRSVRATITFDVVRRRIAHPSESDEQQSAELARFLAPDRRVPVTGPIADEARVVVGDLGDPLDRARALYEHVVASVTYDKSGTGWGEGDALYACDVRSGNCTDFHSLFIGLARASGLPARFVMGFPIPADRTEGEVAGYHCWAEFYIEGRGWLPIDASEASKDPGRLEELFGGLDANRVAFTVGRDIELPSSGERLNFFIYPHVLVDGESHEHVIRRISFVESDAGSSP